MTDLDFWDCFGREKKLCLIKKKYEKVLTKGKQRGFVVLLGITAHVLYLESAQMTIFLDEKAHGSYF